MSNIVEKLVLKFLLQTNDTIYGDIYKLIVRTDNGKPIVRWGRKATGPK
jgi:hypothetical protein